MSNKPVAPAPGPEPQHQVEAELWSFNPDLPAHLPMITLVLVMTADAVKNLGKVKSRRIDWRLVAQALGQPDKAEYLAG